ncbi:MAG: hypothetical protein NTU62_12060 [Spirochaetes bacterium]|nr:hypothetical protein [Spirochaetota bacterium]
MEQRVKWLVYAMPSMHQDISYMKSAGEDLDLFVSEYLKYLDVMDREPTWCYSSEFAYAVRHFLERHPEQLERLRRHVRDGRFGITAQCSGFDPSFYPGEFIIRSVAVAKEWLRSRFDYEPRTLDLADVPDWSPQFPQILRGCEVDLLLVDRMGTGEGFAGGVLDCAEFPGLWETLDSEVLLVLIRRLGWDARAGESSALYPGYWDFKREHRSDQPAMRVWHHVGLDGTSVLAYASCLRYFGLHGLQRVEGAPARNHLDNEEIFFGNLNPGFDPGGIALGVIGFDEEPVNVDRVVEAVAEWNRRKAAERGIDLRLCTAELFAEAMLEQVASGRITPGRYSGIAPGWSYSLFDSADLSLVQYQLPAAEMLASFGALLKTALYPRAALDRAWEILWQVSHNQRSDPSFLRAVVASAKATRGLLRRGMAALSAAVKPGRPGTPILVFNPLNWERTERVRVALPTGNGSTIVDGDGYPVPCTLPGEGRGPGDSSPPEVEFVAARVPGMGYRTFYLASGSVARSDLAVGDTWIENDAFRLEVDGSGNLGMTARRDARQLGGSAAIGGPMRLVGQGPGAELAWKTRSCEPALAGTTARLTVRGELGGCPSAIAFVLTAGSSRVDLEVSLDWDGGRGSQVYLPLPFFIKPDELRLGVACGHVPYLRPSSPAVLRPTPLSRRSAPTGFATHWWFPLPHPPIPGDAFGWAYFQRWVYLGPASGGIVVASGRREGLVVGNDMLGIPLLATPARRERWDRLHNIYARGTHRWSLAFTAVGDVKEAPHFGFEVSQPLLATAEWRAGGTLPDARSLIELSQAVCMAFKRTFDGRGWALRFFESKDEDLEAVVRMAPELGLDAASARGVNLLERQQTPLESRGDGVLVPLRGFEIATLRIDRASG